MPAKGPIMPGYTPLTPRIFVRNGKADATTATDTGTEPTTILVYGWGDGLPKHVLKYGEGYHALFPTARIFVIINPILGATMQSLRRRTDHMRPLVDTLFPGTDADAQKERIILHIMSNTGGIYAAATLNAYREKFGADAGLPHHMCVSDSTPGSLIFSTEVWRWARAMALGMPRWFPWPFSVTQAVCCAYLYFMQYLARAMRIEPSGEYSIKVFLDQTMATPNALRLYMYSKEDDLIYWKDLEAAAATAKSKGYTTVLERFEGSPHVGHMRHHPERYWGVIMQCWKRALEMQKDSS
ncbi:DUF829-domain-containing protein [Xylariaceae sp. FL0255]|nr:DUF829-domain-containing protein [Xylariaceae sp. FL0255]